MSNKTDSKYYPPGTDLRFIPLSSEQERELFRLVRSNGPEADAAREFLVKNHLLFAANLARGMAKGRLPEDEVISAANDALMTAFNKFDPERPSRFNAYLKPFIYGAISRLWASKNPVNYKGNYPLPDDSYGPAHRQEDPTEDHPTEARDHADFMCAALKKASGCLTDSEKDLLTEIYENGLSQSDVARKNKVSREGISKLHSKALKKLRAALEKIGISEL